MSPQPDWLNQGLSYKPQTTPATQTAPASTGSGWSSANMIGMGTQALTGLIGTGVNAWLGSQQLKLAQDQIKAQNAQREIENERYKAQLERLNQATNDAVSTASGLKSATAQVATAKPTQTNQAQTNTATQNAQVANASQAQGAQKQANAQKPQAKGDNKENQAEQASAKELPMQRE